MINICKKSPLTGKINSMQLNITVNQAVRIADRHLSKELIQDIVPDLSKKEREFLISGYTPEDWKTLFGEP